MEKGKVVLIAGDHLRSEMADVINVIAKGANDVIVIKAPETHLSRVELVKPFKIPYKFKKTKRGTNMTPKKKKKRKR